MDDCGLLLDGLVLVIDPVPVLVEDGGGDGLLFTLSLLFGRIPGSWTFVIVAIF